MLNMTIIKNTKLSVDDQKVYGIITNLMMGSLSDLNQVSLLMNKKSKKPFEMNMLSAIQKLAGVNINISELGIYKKFRMQVLRNVNAFIKNKNHRRR